MISRATTPPLPAACTYADLLDRPEGERLELYEGHPVMMSPGPSRRHQAILLELIMQLGAALQNRTEELIAAPFDTRLDMPEVGELDSATVVQPDLLMVCVPERQLDDRGVIGAPDFVVEILSPSSAQNDRVHKLHLYEKFGVREYWIVDPEAESLEVRVLGTDGRWTEVRTFGHADRVALSILPDVAVELGSVLRPI